MKPAKTTPVQLIPESWSQIPYGELYRDSLTDQLRYYLTKLYGFHFVKIGNLSAEIATEECAIAHQVNVGLQGEKLQVRANPFNLPFAAKSVDACLLAHTLSWSNDPHRILREVDRVLIDDGWIILSGFNPFSLLGVGKLLPFMQRKVPYNSRMFTSARLSDWLSLLNYEVIQQDYVQLFPWSSRGGGTFSTHFPALGCLHLIMARKRTFPLTLNTAQTRTRKPTLQPASATRQWRSHRHQETD